MDVNASFKDPQLCHALLERLQRALEGQSPLRFMEVCGTHTVAIFQSGLRDVLPPEVTHLSGPGCPVCVTHDAEVATFVDLAGRDGVIVATFGDLMRVPGPDGHSLKHAQAAGARVEIVYSPLDILTLATQNPHDTVVFLGVGFETTAPTVAATVLMAREQGIKNACVLSFHKLVPPALRALLSDAACAVDAFLLPGHVSTILGLEPYAFLASEFATPSVVAGFEPVDILSALCLLAEQKRAGRAEVVNAYPRAVHEHGNPKARAVLDEVFTTSDALWRGIGAIPQSGLVFKPAFAHWDAMQRLALSLPEVKPLRGCKCGDVLKGKLTPPECPLFNTTCTPAKPVGPCMVSTEGSCAAYAKYHWEA
ncbi:MAG: hydrogenase formation protein HypD [Desulfovibrionaceae bacterium]